MPHESQLSKRLKTLAWSVFWVGLTAMVDHLFASLHLLNLPTVDFYGQSINTAVIVGLVLNQVSKWVHSQSKTIGV